MFKPSQQGPPPFKEGWGGGTMWRSPIYRILDFYPLSIRSCFLLEPFVDRFVPLFKPLLKEVGSPICFFFLIKQVPPIRRSRPSYKGGVKRGEVAPMILVRGEDDKPGSLACKGVKLYES